MSSFNILFIELKNAIENSVMLVLMRMNNAAKNMRFLSVSVICSTDRKGLNLYIKNAHIVECNMFVIARI